METTCRFERGSTLSFVDLVKEIEAGRWVIIHRGSCYEPERPSVLASMTLASLIECAADGRAFRAIRLMVPSEVIKELAVVPGIEPATIDSEGNPLDEDGDTIDPIQLEPHVFALGPFGSWPETEADARNTIRQHKTWREGRSIRVGRCATWKPGWGFALREAPEGC